MNDSKNVPPAVTWGPDERAWASLLLFAHLFAVAVAITTYTRPSNTQLRLHELFAPYLRVLHLSPFPVTYPFARFHFTHAQPTDIDFAIEIQASEKSGQADPIRVPPSPPLRPAIRQRRYQAIANAAGALADEQTGGDLGGVLTRSVAGSVLKQTDSKEGTVKVRAHFLPEMETMGETEVRRQAALSNYRDVYDAQVFNSGGQIEIVKRASTLESAPVRGPASPSGAKSK